MASTTDTKAMRMPAPPSASLVVTSVRDQMDHGIAKPGTEEEYWALIERTMKHLLLIDYKLSRTHRFEAVIKE